MRYAGVGGGLGLLSKLTDAVPLVEAVAAAGGAGQAQPTFPARAIIRTMLKDVAPSELANKVTLFHEHISSMGWQLPKPGYAYAATRPHNFREDIDYQVEEVRLAGQDGIGCIVDGTHPEMGRSLEFLKEVQRRSGVLVVGSGGFYLQTTYPPELATMSEDAIAENLVLEVNYGHLGAFGEIGTSTEISPEEKKVLRAVGKAQVQTNIPIFGHTDIRPEAKKTAMEQLDIYESVGVKPSSVVIGHLQGFDDPALHAAVAKRGAWVAWDRVANMGNPDNDAKSVQQILKFIDAGYVNQLLLSSDFSQERETKQKGGPGYAKTFTVFVPKLRAAGVKEEILHQVMYDNPRRFLAFVPKFVPKK
jgi:phosphotriesterase-related protein